MLTEFTPFLQLFNTLFYFGIFFLILNLIHIDRFHLNKNQCKKMFMCTALNDGTCFPLTIWVTELNCSDRQNMWKQNRSWPGYY